MTSEYRALTDVERQLADQMLSGDFHGQKELRVQLETAVVRVVVQGDDYLVLGFDVGDAPLTPFRRNVLQRIAEDEDRVSILAILHVRDGKLLELETVKSDASRIIKMPAAAQFRVDVDAERKL